MDVISINSVTLYLSLILALLGSLVVWFYKKSFTYWKKRGLNYLEPTIPFGNALDVMLKKITMGELFSRQYLKIKEMGLKHAGTYFYWRPVYIPTDPEIIKHILISDFEYFPNHGLYVSEDNDPFSGHVFNLENTKWKNIRTKLPSAFTAAKMRRMFLIMGKLTQSLMKNLEKYENGNSLNVKSELSRFTMDVISSCAFGIEANTMKRENEDLIKQGRSFFDAQWDIYKNILVLTIPRAILQKFKFRIMPKAFENYFFDLFRNIMNYRKESQVSRSDIADTLLRLTERHEDQRDILGKPLEPISFEEFAAQAVIFVAAGFETSSSTVTFALYELCKSPLCQNRLRGEINEVLKRHNYNVTYDALMEIKYLDRVLDETLRLYPVFPILPRESTKEYKVPGTDITLEANTFVLISNMGIQRDPEYYPDPEKFDPDRFLPENKAKRPFVSHLPFGEGPRICVGKRFGLLQSKLALLTIIRNYEVSLSDKTRKSFKFSPNELMLRKTGDIWLNIKKI